MSKPTQEQQAAREPFRQDVSDRDADSRGAGETEFEKRRGVNRVEIRSGLTRAYVSALAEPIMDARLRVLSAVREVGVSIDFLKFAHSAMSFVAPESDQPKLEKALKSLGVKHELEGGRCVVIVYAVNMQDEEGLVARIVSEVIASGEEVEHVGDMHDRLLLVTDVATGERLAVRLRERIPEEVVG